MQISLVPKYKTLETQVTNSAHFYTCMATVASTFEPLTFDLGGAQTASSSTWSRLPVSNINQRGSFYGFQTTVIKEGCAEKKVIVVSAKKTLLLLI